MKRWPLFLIFFTSLLVVLTLPLSSKVLANFQVSQKNQTRLSNAYEQACKAESELQRQFLRQLVTDLWELGNQFATAVELRNQLKVLEESSAQLEEQKKKALEDLGPGKFGVGDFDFEEKYREVENEYLRKIFQNTSEANKLVEEFVSRQEPFSLSIEESYHFPKEGLPESNELGVVFYNNGEGGVLVDYSSRGEGNVSFIFNHQSSLAKLLLFSRDTDTAGKMYVGGFDGRMAVEMELPSQKITFRGDDSSEDLDEFLENERAVCLENRLYWMKKDLHQ